MNSRRLWMMTLASAMLAGGCRQEPPEPQVAPVEAAQSEAPAARLPVADVAVLRGLIAEAVAADQVVVIDFWATWCKPCVAMFPALHDGLLEMGDAVRPITVTFDDPGGTEPQAVTFLEQHHALQDAYTLTVDPTGRAAVVDTLGDQWNMLVVPAVLIFDREGNLAGEFFGGEAAPILEMARKLTGPDTDTPLSRADPG